ncbi:MAG TPA: acyl-CoA dehydrogenase family protein [Alphaproteobacteria bacterium]|jgi:alkylation response protein AidB-like acyl-CoA dehydrogenase|nr:acyl-CoA dehydrogenase family protein [Alphaproteobacteria bacterium]
MDFRFTEDQLTFRDAVSDFLTGECTPAAIRALLDSPDGGALKFRAALAELGVAGLPIAEEHGGLGMNELDAVLVSEECGRAAVPGAVFDSIAVAAPLLAEAAPELAAEWLPKVAAGEATLALAHDINPFVLDADIADLFLVAKEGALYAVPKSGATLTEAPSADPSRRPARVAFDIAAGQKIADGNSAAGPVARALDRAALYAAADMLGATQRMLDLSVEYTKNREQFGKPIGSFQAVKHLLADVQVKLTFARPVVYYAAYALVNGLPDRSVRVSHAKAAAADAAMLAARRCLQVHGAMGYTWEYDLQIWMKRVWATAACWGTSAWHRNRIADAILAPGADLGPGRTWAA